MKLQVRVPAILFLFGPLAHASSPGTESPLGQVTGPPVLVTSERDSHCSPADFPDAPARAFRDAAGNIHVFVAGVRNRQAVGTSLFHGKYVCVDSFKGLHSPDPSIYDDYGWLAAFFTKDGVTIDALVHNEYHGSEHQGACAYPGSPGCDETDITAAVSHDSGLHFDHIPVPSGVIATLPYRYGNGRSKQFGFYNPTNIIAVGGFFYTFAGVIDPVHNLGGRCLLRSALIENPKSWRGWDGSGFNVPFADPYTGENSTSKTELCSPVAPGRLLFGMGSVSWDTASRIYVAAMRNSAWDRSLKDGVPGVYLSASKDLFHWSKPSLLLSDAQAKPCCASSAPLLFYPSLLDPRATGKNFDNITDEPYLFAVQIFHGQPNTSRNVVAFPVRLHLEYRQE